MNNERFDKLFGDKLNEGKDFPFSEEKWDKMGQHLDTSHANERRRRLLAWAIVPFLALIG